MQQPVDAGGLAGRDRALRQPRVRAFEVLRGAVQDADEVDDRVLAGGQAGERRVVVDVGIDHIAGRQQDQVLGLVAPTRRHEHAAP